MTDTDAEPFPRRLFNRATAGCALAPVEVEIDRFQVRFFADVLGLTDPIYHDVAAARASGFRDLVTPPTFFMAIDSAADRQRVLAGRPTLLEFISADLKYLLHGEERYNYEAPLCAGDRIILTTQIGDFIEKKGGMIELVTINSEVLLANIGRSIRAQRTLIHRFVDKI